MAKALRKAQAKHVARVKTFDVLDEVDKAARKRPGSMNRKKQR